MLISRLQPSLRTVLTAVSRTNVAAGQSGLNEAFAALRVCAEARPSVSLMAVRHASHKAQGAVNKAKDGPGKRLGAKKSGEQYVIPGNIIFRQRGTHWFAGDNCAMGRDHTIYATEAGYVKYYKDPEKHAKRQYIGVVFERSQVLPLPRNSMRRRRLGVVPQQMDISTLAPEPVAEDVEAVEGDAAAAKPKVVERRGEEGRNLTLRPGYMYRESNWEIGRAAERAGVQVKAFKPRDRWTAWKKTTVRKLKNQEKRSLRKKPAPKKKQQQRS